MISPNFFITRFFHLTIVHLGELSSSIKKSNSLCSSPTRIYSSKTTTVLRNNNQNHVKQRPLSTTIEFPLRKTILRMLSFDCSKTYGGSCNSLAHNSCSSSSSVCSFQSSSELSSSTKCLSNINLSNEKFEGLKLNMLFR